MCLQLLLTASLHLRAGTACTLLTCLHACSTAQETVQRAADWYYSHLGGQVPIIILAGRSEPLSSAAPSPVKQGPLRIAPAGPDGDAELDALLGGTDGLLDSLRLEEPCRPTSPAPGNVQVGSWHALARQGLPESCLYAVPTTQTSTTVGCVLNTFCMRLAMQYGPDIVPRPGLCLQPHSMRTLCRSRGTNQQEDHILRAALLQGVTIMAPAQYVATMHGSQPVIMDMYESLTQARLATALESASGKQAGHGSAAAATDHGYPAHLGAAALDDALNYGLAWKVGGHALSLAAIKAGCSCSTRRLWACCWHSACSLSIWCMPVSQAAGSVAPSSRSRVTRHGCACQTLLCASAGHRAHGQAGCRRGICAPDQPGRAGLEPRAAQGEAQCQQGNAR